MFLLPVTCIITQSPFHLLYIYIYRVICAMEQDDYYHHDWRHRFTYQYDGGR